LDAERVSANADRIEAERLLAEDLLRYADGVGAAWRLLAPIEEGEKVKDQVFEATAYMAEIVSRPDTLSYLRAMAEILGWERRRKYLKLIGGLEQLKDFTHTEAIKNDPDAALSAIRALGDDFEACLPDTSKYFEGLWRRTAKGMDFGMMVEHIADLQ
jgi:hypothetical protein